MEHTGEAQSSVEPESWTPWYDDRIERAVAEVFNFRKAGMILELIILES